MHVRQLRQLSQDRPPAIEITKDGRYRLFINGLEVQAVGSKKPRRFYKLESALNLAASIAPLEFVELRGFDTFSFKKV